ncbi:hypothetical protein AB1N83_005957 [Pleurotus pulmonarius]
MKHLQINIVVRDQGTTRYLTPGLASLILHGSATGGANLFRMYFIMSRPRVSCIHLRQQVSLTVVEFPPLCRTNVERSQSLFSDCRLGDPSGATCKVAEIHLNIIASLSPSHICSGSYSPQSNRRLEESHAISDSQMVWNTLNIHQPVVASATDKKCSKNLNAETLLDVLDVPLNMT